MTTEYFVNQLELLKPKSKDLKKLGFDGRQITNIIDSYKCLKKVRKSFKPNIDNIILSLMQQYDCSNVQIGVIQFSEDIIEYENFYSIGNVEADILVLDRINYRIEVRDYTSLDNILWSCSSNSENFLHALLVAAEFFSERIKNPVLVSNHSYTYNNIVRCANISGGDEYFEFYKMLFAFYE